MRFLAILISSAFLLGIAPVAKESDGALKATLANGLRVVIVRDAIAPAVSTEVTYLVGSRDDDPKYPGLAHAQEHMMYRGTHDLSTDQLSTIATALGGSFNAFTRPTVTSYQFTVPAINLDAVLRIESDRMTGALDLQDQWADERGAIEQEVSSDESTPGADFFAAAQARAYAGTAYAHDGVGTKAAFDKLTGPELKAFHDRWYAPNNAVLVIVGDIDPQTTLNEVKTRFESVARKSIPDHPKATFEKAHRIELHRATSLTYPLAAVGYRLPGVHDPDFISSFVLQAVINSERGDLKALTANGKAIFSGFESMALLPDAQLGFAVAALGPGIDPDRAVQKLEAVLGNYAAHGVPRELFETTKRRVIADQELSRNSITELASDWSDVIAVDNESSIAHEQELLRGVSLADVDRIAKKYFVASHAIVGALRPSLNGSSEPPSTGDKGKEAPLPQRPPTTALPSWAQPLLSTINAPPPAVSPSDMRLPNGLRLIVRSTNVSHTVYVFGGVQTNPGLEEPAGKEGIASVLEGLFAFGSAGHDRTTYQRSLDDIGASETGGASFAIESTSTTFDRAVDLLAENELHPRFDERTFTMARDLTAQQIGSTQNGSHVVGERKLREKLLPTNDPELRDPSPRGIEGLALADAREYYAKAFRPDLTTIVVAGDITPERARAAVEHAFGGWSASGPAPTIVPPPVPLNTAANVGVTPPSLHQDFVTLTELLGVTRSDPRYYAFDLGNTIFGGGVGGPQQSRLFRDLRQQTGLVYFVNSALNVGKTRARMEISFACAPENLARAQAIVENDLKSLASEPVSPFELSLAKASVVRRNIVDGGGVSAIAQAYLRRAQNGRALDEDRAAAEGYLATTPASLREAFAAYVRPNAFIRLVEGPQ